MSSKTLLNCIFVAEGKRDEEKLKKLDIPYIVRTDGLNVPRETTKHLQELAKIHEVIILTDPDGPGQKIADKLLQEIPNAKVIKVIKKKAVKKGKDGIEHIPLPLLAELIKPYKQETFTTSSDVTLIKLLDLGLSGPNSQFKKIKLATKYSLLVASLKNMLTQIQLLNISYKELKEALSE